MPGGYGYTSPGASSVTTRPSLLGSRFIAHGTSYLTAGGANQGDAQWLTLLTGMLRADGTDRGIGGAQMACDEAWVVNPASSYATQTSGKGGWAYALQNTVPSIGTAPYTPAGYLPLVVGCGNDLLYRSHDATGSPRTILKTGLRTIISRLCAVRLFESTDSTLVLSGTTWQAAVACTVRNSGPSHQPVPGTGGVFTFTIPADYEGGTIAFGFTVWPTGDGTVTWSGTAFTGGGGTIVNPGVTDMSGLAYAAGGLTATPNRDSSNGHVVRLSGSASDAGRTIIGTVGGTTTVRSAGALPSAPTVTTQGTTGGITYQYTRVYRYYNGDTVPSSVGQVTTGNATLNGTNFNRIAAGAAWPAGVDQEIIVRSSVGAATSPTTTGIVAVLTAGPLQIDDLGTSSPAINVGRYNLILNPPVAYTSATATCLTGGFSLDYVQFEATSPAYSGIVTTIPKLLNYGSAGATDADVVNYNTDITAVAAEFGWTVVDLDAVLQKSATLFASDGVHPNNRGHAAIAARMKAAIDTLGQSLPVATVAHHSRIRRGVNSHSLVSQFYSPNDPTKPALGTIAAASLPNTAAGTAHYTLDSTWRFLDGQVAAILNADVGDDLIVDLSGYWAAAANAALLDVAICDAGGTAIRWMSSQTATQGAAGYGPWRVDATQTTVTPVNGWGHFKVQPADLITVFTIPGQVWLRLAGRSASGRTLYGGGDTSTYYGLVLEVTNKSARNGGANSS